MSNEAHSHTSLLLCALSRVPCGEACRLCVSAPKSSASVRAAARHSLLKLECDAHLTWLLLLCCDQQLRAGSLPCWVTKTDEDAFCVIDHWYRLGTS